MKPKFKLLVPLLILVYAGFSQEPLKHQKRVYVSPEGRIYINKALPIYLKMSTSPDESATNYLLKSEETERYANPMYFDTEGYNSFRSPSEVDTATKRVIYPLEDIVFEVYADSRAPYTSLKFGKAVTNIKNGKTYINGDITLTLSANDEVSGVDKIYYSINGEPFNPVTNNLQLTEEKEYLIKYYAVDNVGNVEKIKSITIVLDKTSPKTKMNITGDVYQNIHSGRSKIELIAEDISSGVSRIIYQIDEQDLKTYKVPFNTVYMAQGEHRLKYYSVDNLNNQEPEQIYEFYVDKTAPTIVQEIIGKSFFANGKEFSSGRAQLKLTTFDNKAGVKEVMYSINNQEYKIYENPVFLSSTSGNLSIRLYALDYVNNKSIENDENARTEVPFIDLTGPTLKHGYNGPVFAMGDSTFISPKTKIMIKANDPDAGVNHIEYQTDNDSIKIFSEPFTVSAQGLHTISATGYDNVENTNQHSFSFIVDNSGPEIFERYSTVPLRKQQLDGKELSVFPPHVVLFIAATDLQSGFDHFTYTLNSQPEKPFTGFIGNFNKSGAYTIKIKAFDKLGNLTEKTFEFSICK